MRIKIEGSITRERVMQVVSDLLAREPDIATMSGFNFYFYPRDAQGRTMDFMDREGQPIKMLVYRERRDVESTPQQQPGRKSQKLCRSKAKKPVLRLVQNNAPVPSQATPNAA